MAALVALPQADDTEEWPACGDPEIYGLVQGGARGELGQHENERWVLRPGSERHGRQGDHPQPGTGGAVARHVRTAGAKRTHGTLGVSGASRDAGGERGNPRYPAAGMRPAVAIGRVGDDGGQLDDG